MYSIMYLVFSDRVHLCFLYINDILLQKSCCINKKKKYIYIFKQMFKTSIALLIILKRLRIKVFCEVSTIYKYNETREVKKVNIEIVNLV